MLHNNQQAYTVCLMVPNLESLKRFAKEKSIDTTTDDGLKELLKSLEKEVSEYRTGGKFSDMFPQRWLPAAIAILDEGFTEANTLLNSTLKMVRPKINERYAELLDYLYTPNGKNITNERNLQSLKKLLR